MQAAPGAVRQPSARDSNSVFFVRPDVSETAKL
jgi:hypothetical protein